MSSRIQQIVDDIRLKKNILGMVVGVYDGEHLIQVSSGYSHDYIPLDHYDLFKIGSLTKLFTGNLIKIAIQDNRLTLEDVLSKNLIGIGSGFVGSLTVKAMLTHTSGLPRDFPGIFRTRQDLINQAIRWTPSSIPFQATYCYSNVGYVLLRWMLEDIYGKSYDDLVKLYIFTPLSMHSTSLGSESKYGVGSYLSTLADMSRYLVGNFEDGILLSCQEILVELNEFFVGYAWESWNGNVLHKNGQIDEFSSSILVNPRREYGIVVMTNSKVNEVNRLSTQLLHRIFQ